MTAPAFGRKGAGFDPDMAARRAAFLAEERARAAAAPAERKHDDTFDRPRLTERPYMPRKTMGTAYLLWFFLGGASAHRFYLGYRVSGIFQLILTPLGYAMLMTKSSTGLLLVPIAGLWILADAFLIPGMVAAANERARGSSLASTFA